MLRLAIGARPITTAAGSVGGGSERSCLARVPIGRQMSEASMRGATRCASGVERISAAATCREDEVASSGVCAGFRTSVVRVGAAGCGSAAMTTRCRIVCRRLEWPQAVSSVRISAATHSPVSVRFLVASCCALRASRLKAFHVT